MKRAISIIFLFIICVSAQNQKKVSDFSVKLENGKSIQFYDLLEKGPVLIDFWATWCEPCKKEMRFLNRYHNEYKNFNVLAINQDKTRSISRVKSFVRSRKYDFIVGLDPSGKIFKELNAFVMPTNILVDTDAAILWQHQGYLPGDEEAMEAAIKAAVNKDEE